MGDNVRLGYKLKYPLDMVISEQCIDKYNSIFFFLMKIKRINNVLAILWKFLSSHEFRRIKDEVEYAKIRRVQLLRNRM